VTPEQTEGRGKRAQGLLPSDGTVVKAEINDESNLKEMS
jgi:hypothetical protein